MGSWSPVTPAFLEIGVNIELKDSKPTIHRGGFLKTSAIVFLFVTFLEGLSWGCAFHGGFGGGFQSFVPMDAEGKPIYYNSGNAELDKQNGIEKSKNLSPEGKPKQLQQNTKPPAGSPQF